MPEPWVLAVDLGTTDLKVGAVSLRGDLLANAHRPIETRHLPGGGAEQDPDAWWGLIRSACRAVLESAAVDAAELIGVGITGQYSSTVPVDADGRATGPCILWQDTRGASYSAQAMGGAVSVLGYSPVKILRWLRMTGGLPSTRGADPLNHELFLKHREPELYARTHVLLEPLDYLGLRFTGRVAATPGSMTASWLTDNRPGTSLRYVPELIRLCGRDPDRLPPLIATGSVLGTVLPDVANELGIRSVPVVAGLPDLHAAFIGSGATEPYQAHVTISTTSWISCEVPFKKADILHQMTSIPSGLRAGRYLVINNQETAGLCLKWVQDSVVPADYDALTALAAAAPAGAGGVMFTPWMTGERSPVEDRTLRSAFVNVSIGTGKAELVRSVLEGVAFNSRWLLDAVEKYVGRTLASLRIQGGGAQSDLWCQVYADILGRRIERVADPRFHSLKGAGLFAAISLGKLSLDDVPRLVRVTDVFEPLSEHRDVYEPMYAEFKRFYSAMHGIYARLNSRRS